MVVFMTQTDDDTPKTKLCKRYYFDPLHLAIPKDIVTKNEEPTSGVELYHQSITQIFTPISMRYLYPGKNYFFLIANSLGGTAL